jgi:hypothetical protein
MAQCQTNPEGRCTMEPPCPPGECYLGSVLLKEHAALAASVEEQPSVARYLAGVTLPYAKVPIIEGEEWETTKLALVNAVIDSLVPGARLVVESDDETGEPARVYLGRGRAFERPRSLPTVLRQLADSLDGGGS